MIPQNRPLDSLKTHFTDVLWPAFRKIDFLRAIRAYQDRNRRFGR